MWKATCQVNISYHDNYFINFGGVGIQALTNTGLFEKTQLAKNKVKESEEIQNYTLAEYEQQIDSYTRSESSSSVKNI